MDTLLSLAFNSLSEQITISKELKQRSLNEWKAALLMPRKKKKIAKKSAILLYSIACYSESILNNS